MNQKKRPLYLTIVLWFIFFWPVGVFMLWRRLSNDKAAALKNSKVLTGIGIFFIVCAVIMLTVYFEEGADAGSMMGGILFYLVGGILIILAAKKVRESGERCKKYIEIVINQQQYTIENIAAQVGTGYNQAVKDLQEMIDKGYFANAHIDYSSHEILFAQEQHSVPNDNTQATPTQQKIVRCASCGGNNTIIVGNVCECDFCGMPIK